MSPSVLVSPSVSLNDISVPDAIPFYLSVHLKLLVIILANESSVHFEIEIFSHYFISPWEQYAL